MYLLDPAAAVLVVFAGMNPYDAAVAEFPLSHSENYSLIAHGSHSSDPLQRSIVVVAGSWSAGEEDHIYTLQDSLESAVVRYLFVKLVFVEYSAAVT
mmetsp:Transcript_27840/g.41217  ORF Transcript_27840/g.41217 Transcript_27840/m.41217 type:complete len:97 (+) Transcript_27840:764-1054(+)